MKTCVNNQEVAHLWAHAAQDYARGSNMYFRGSVVYSYGEHFPMGIRFTDKSGEPVFVLTDDGYSPTTSGHQNYVRRAVNHYGKTFHVPSLRGIYPDTPPEEIAETVKRYVAESLDQALKMKKTEPRYQLAEKANRYHEAMLRLGAELGQLNKFARIMGSIRAKREKTLDGAMEYREKLAIAKAKGDATRAKNWENRHAIAAEKQKKREEQEKLDREKWEIEKPQAIADWRNGKPLDSRYNRYSYSYPYNASVTDDVGTMLRLSEDKKEIETSQSAHFPVEHAVKLFPLWRTLVSHKREYNRNGHTIHLGPYALDSIDSEGNIKAGCHYIKREEVEHIARILGLMPVLGGNV